MHMVVFLHISLKLKDSLFEKAEKRGGIGRDYHFR